MLLSHNANKYIKCKHRTIFELMIDFEEYCGVKREIRDLIELHRYKIERGTYELQNEATKRNMIYLNMVNNRYGKILNVDMMGEIYKYLYEDVDLTK